MCNIIVILIFISCILNRYLTESYGTGQDIDDRIVEGIVNFKTSYFMLLRYVRESSLSGLECSPQRGLKDSPFYRSLLRFHVLIYLLSVVPSTNVSAKMAGILYIPNLWNVPDA